MKSNQSIQINEDNTVTVILSNGDRITLREPLGKDMDGLSQDLIKIKHTDQVQKLIGRISSPQLTRQQYGKLIRYQGALQQEDGGTYQELKGEARGRIIEADPGSDKQGEGGEHKFKIALVYWKETLDGQEILEIDVLANKASFGGKDERAGLRKALGMM